MCMGMAASLAEQIDTGTGRSALVEATLTGMLVTCLTPRAGNPDQEQRAQGTEPPSAVQLGHLRRICRAIETRLGDAELSIDAIADAEGLSPRYLQKLFKGAAPASAPTCANAGWKGAAAWT
ncbi:MAP3K12-binding inhibitory protein 1 [Manis javanica]|nr:MAP3K12-binding inhibitory protein 1 [Manis javanica]